MSENVLVGDFFYVTGEEDSNSAPLDRVRCGITSRLFPQPPSRRFFMKAYERIS